MSVSGFVTSLYIKWSSNNKIYVWYLKFEYLSMARIPWRRTICHFFTLLKHLANLKDDSTVWEDHDDGWTDENHEKLNKSIDRLFLNGFFSDYRLWKLPDKVHWVSTTTRIRSLLHTKMQWNEIRLLCEPEMFCRYRTNWALKYPVHIK